MASDEMSEIAGFSAARAMLSLAAPPTAFLVSSMISGLGVRRAIETAGLVMGRDISVIIHDDVLSYMRNGDPAGVDVPIFTATRSSVRDAGRMAAGMLLDIVADPDHTPRERLLEAELVLGQSTGPAR
jgi:LacI family transcriptional regulator